MYRWHGFAVTDEGLASPFGRGQRIKKVRKIRCHSEPVVLRAANQNLNDCQWQSYLNVTQTGVALFKDSLRSQSILQAFPSGVVLRTANQNLTIASGRHTFIAIRNILMHFRRCGRGILKGAAFRQRPLSRLLLNVLAETRTLPPEEPAPKVSRSLGTYA